jgi:hypothetical protein
MSDYKKMISTKASYTTKHYQKLSDPLQQRLLCECIGDFLDYLLIEREITLHHKISRDPTRKSNQNITYTNTSILYLMERFTLNANLFETYEIPMILMPFSKFYSSFCSQKVKRGTLYRVLDQITVLNFRKKYPHLTFHSISKRLESEYHRTIPSYEIERLIKQYQAFLQARRSYDDR